MEFEADKAYQGGINITTPHKKKRKQELNEKQKIEFYRNSLGRAEADYSIDVRNYVNVLA
ncbi:hypothetical protein [Mastigocoleus testarum]|uniref:Uncharacterized protein n=1 Tax=Mastigocoleus testarum BC008 TaxID=371196 RepID=A0A0V7ZGG7_9CYAN|nr:hypothetical protein [Mastigocoleus testarum]KST63549.1 hypothetical protein BC008_13880 [Mastigocoleus testarum BC008]